MAYRTYRMLACKKLWFFYFVLIATAVIQNKVAAQTQDTVVVQKIYVPSTSVGFKAGYNLSQISFSPSISQEMTRTITAGVILNHFAQPYAGVQVELNYTRVGWTLSENGGSQRLNYLEVPAFTHIQIGKKNGALLLNLGPYISFLISKRDTLLFPQTPSTEQSFNVVPNRVHYGLAAGLGYLQKTALGNFQFEARFTYALGNVLRNEPISISQNQAITACIGYLIERRKK
jgi:hypothetical protein